MGSPNGREVEERKYLSNRPKYKARRTFAAFGGRILCRNQSYRLIGQRYGVLSIFRNIF